MLHGYVDIKFLEEPKPTAMELDIHLSINMVNNAVVMKIGAVTLDTHVADISEVVVFFINHNVR